MTSRRDLLFGVTGSLSVAGCLGSVGGRKSRFSQTDSNSITEDNTDNSESEAKTNPPKGLPDFQVENIELNYAPYVGITTLISIKSEDGEGTQTAHIVTEAHEKDGLLVEDSRWENVPDVSMRPVKLRIDDVFDLVENLDNVVEFVIKGRIPDGEYGEIKSFSGSAFRDEIGIENVTKNDGDVEVEIESNDETENDSDNEGTTDGPD